MLEKVRGIVVHTVKYGDASVICDVYTDKYGTLSFIVGSPRRGRSVTRSLMLSPLAILEIDFDYREGRNLLRVREVRVEEPYRSLPYHPIKETIALFLSEFLYYTLRNEQPNPELFEFLVDSLLWLDNRDRRIANFPATFLLRLTRFLGIWPNEEEIMPLLSRDEARVLPLVLRMNYGTMHLFRFSTTQRSRLLKVINDYYRLHVAGFPELKSLAILREVLSQ